MNDYINLTILILVIIGIAWIIKNYVITTNGFDNGLR